MGAKKHVAIRKLPSPLASEIRKFAKIKGVAYDAFINYFEKFSPCEKLYSSQDDIDKGST